MGGVLGALGLGPARIVQADTSFTEFKFPATGAPAARTMPDRLSDVINVKDWGAVGNGFKDDAPAINAAIQYCITRGGGTGGKVFFPIGQYRLHRALVVGHDTYNVAVQLIGAGADAVTLAPSGVSGPAVSSGGKVYDCLDRIEAISAGYVKMTRDSCSCEQVAGNFDLSGAKNGCLVNCRSSGSNAGPAEGPTNVHGVWCALLGEGCSAFGCRFMGCTEVGYVLCGDGAGLYGCSGEGHWCVIRIGWLPGVGETPNPVYGCTVQAFQTEQSVVAVDLYHCDSCYIAGAVQTGSVGLPDPQTITAGSYNAGAQTAELTTSGNHNIAAPRRIQILFPGNANWLPHPGGYLDVTPTAANKFQYSLTSNPGAWNGGYWTWPAENAIKVRKAYNCVITGIRTAPVAYSTVDLSYRNTLRPWGTESESANADHRNNLFVGLEAYLGWTMPAAKNRTAWQFINCTGGSNDVGDAAALPVGNITYANLPGQAGVNQPLMETQEFDIIDGNPGGAAWGATITGGGSGHYRVRWNGANWVRVG
jgi:hypothetical protein